MIWRKEIVEHNANKHHSARECEAKIVALKKENHKLITDRKQSRTDYCTIEAEHDKAKNQIKTAETEKEELRVQLQCSKELFEFINEEFERCKKVRLMDKKESAGKKKKGGHEQS